ncbi:MAG: hypothetical protein QW101_05730 [Ignisphaera sp.]|uniref:Uncharacterized protein n=1 Tax=Ignisphaera aggregans TaxID=334771 RepID=A0A7J3MXB0_9CREN
MTQGKLVRAIGYYHDASYIERIVATFRKLLIDVDWIYGRRINDEGLFEIYLLVKDHPNLQLAILNLSKTVSIERVDVFNDLRIEVLKVGNKNKNSKTIEQHDFVLYIPIYSRVVSYSWGERYGENI